MTAPSLLAFLALAAGAQVPALPAAAPVPLLEVRLDEDALPSEPARRRAAVDALTAAVGLTPLPEPGQTVLIIPREGSFGPGPLGRAQRDLLIRDARRHMAAQPEVREASAAPEGAVVAVLKRPLSGPGLRALLDRIPAGLTARVSPAPPPGASLRFIPPAGRDAAAAAEDLRRRALPGVKAVAVVSP